MKLTFLLKAFVTQASSSDICKSSRLLVERVDDTLACSDTVTHTSYCMQMMPQILIQEILSSFQLTKQTKQTVVRLSAF